MEYSLEGIDSNAFSVMNYVSSCMKKEYIPMDAILAYRSNATEGSYDDLLQISMEVIRGLNEK